MRQLDVDFGALRSALTRALPGCKPGSLERVATGVSTPVYRVLRSGQAYVVRLAESATASLAPEALAHDLLRKQGIRVPAIACFEPFDPDLQRSLMVTSQISGQPLATGDPGAARDAILADAGRDLAMLHTVAVDGFGWVRRDLPGLHGAVPHLAALALEDSDAHLATIATALSRSQIVDIRAWVARAPDFVSGDPAVLVHGDLDATHIFQESGRYTGIIDLGEIRGAEPCYDLGQLALREGEHASFPLLPGILAGYREVTALPDDHLARISLWSLLIGVRALARAIERDSANQRHLVRAVSSAVRSLAAI